MSERVNVPLSIAMSESSPEISASIPPKKQGLGWVLAATILGSSMAFIDVNVVNVALPVIQRDLNATSTDIQWVVEAYTLFLGALILVGGSLGDRFGRKRIFLIGVSIFATASAWCGLAPEVHQLILARGVQGVGGALLTPGSLSIINSTFPPLQRSKAIGTWSAFSAITSALGPVLGGWLVQAGSWRLVFFINIPLALLVLTISFWRMPESRNERSSVGLDWPGALLGTLGLGGIVFALIETSSSGLGDPLVLSFLGLGGLMLLGFILVELRSNSPMVPLHLFRSPTFAGANLLTFCLYAGLGGALFFVPFDLIRVQHYSTAAAGASLLPFTLLMFSLSRWSSGLVHRFGAKLPLMAGPLIAAYGFILFARPSTGGSYWTTFFPAIVVLGLGMSITVAPLTMTVMGALENRYSGVASGINNAVARVGGLLAIAVLNIFVLKAFNADLDKRLMTLRLPAAVRVALNSQRGKLAGIEIPAGIDRALRHALEQALALSFVTGFRLAMASAAFLAILGALWALFLVEGKPEQKPSLPHIEERAPPA